MSSLWNFVAFQICWFAGVLGAARGMPWLGPLVTGAWIAVHVPAQQALAGVEGRLLLLAAVMGWSADSILVLLGLIAFPEYARLGAPSTVWMVALWVAFAATLRHSLGWLRGRWMVAVLLGAVGGPLAYLGGQALGAITVNETSGAIGVGIQYALATPLLMLALKRMEGAAEGLLPAGEAR